MKKIIALLLVAAMTVSLVACGGNDKKENAGDNQAQVENGATAGDPAADPNQPAAGVEGPEQIEGENQPSDQAPVEGETVGQILLKDFQDRMSENPAQSSQELADALITNEIILFSPATMAVEQGLLTGFNNAEITGFKEGTMFAPMMGTIPFVGYIFVLEDGADVEAFKQNLQDNADPRWNICTEAEETVVDSVENTVFFLMCPSSMEE